MKRMRLMALVLTVALLGTGCGVSQTKLTSQENDMIAEYIAGLLLKYDLRYDEKLLYDNKQEENLEGTVTEELPTPSQQPTQNQSTTTQESVSMLEESTPVVYQTVSEVYGMEGCKVNYVDAKEYQSFPERSENSYFLLEANKNKKLLVLTFEVKNEGTKSKNFCLIDSGVTYGLEDSKGKFNKPLLTALTNDLQYLDIQIGAGKTEKSVIVFELPEDANRNDYILYITKGDMKAKVTIK